MEELKIICPCCNTELFIDPEKKVLLRHEEVKKTKASFDEMMDNVKKQAEKRKEIFSQEITKEKNKKEILDQRFKQVLSEFKDDGSKPVTPFDFD